MVLLEKDLTDATKEAETLRAHIKTLASGINTLKESKDEQSERLKQLMDEIQAKYTEINKLTLNNHMQTQELINANKQITQLKQEIEIFELTNPATETTQKLIDANQEITQLQQEIKNKDNALKASDKGAELSKLTKELDDANKQITKLEQEIATLKSKNPTTGTTQELDKANKKITQLEQEIIKLNSKNFTLLQSHDSTIKKLLIVIIILTLAIIAFITYPIFTNKTENTTNIDKDKLTNIDDKDKLEV
jgi:chromosome segregation ATPase